MGKFSALHDIGSGSTTPKKNTSMSEPIRHDEGDEVIEEKPHNLRFDNNSGQYPPMYHTVSRDANGNLFYKFNLIGPIPTWDNAEYIELIYVLLTADENATVLIDIDSPGGDIKIGSVIASCVHITKAKVITNNIASSASCGAFIWSLGHEQKISDYSNFLFHMSSQGGVRGVSTNILESVKDTISYVSKYLLGISLAKGHLTQEEYDSIINKNKTVIISGEEMQKRIEGPSVAQESIDSVLTEDFTIEANDELLHEEDDSFDESAFESFVNIDKFINNSKATASIDMSSRKKILSEKIEQMRSMSSEAVPEMSSVKITPSNIMEMLFMGIPIAIEEHSDTKYLMLPPSDMSFMPFIRNLVIYLNKLDPSVTVNIMTFIDIFASTSYRSDDMLRFMSIIENIPNKTIGHAYGLLSPVETIIHLMCDDIRITPYSEFTFKSGQFFSPYTDDPSSYDINRQILGRLQNKGAITATEIEELLEVTNSQKEIRISGTEMMRRLNT